MNKKTQYRARSDVRILSDKGHTHVAILVGGMSAEREVSLISARGVSKALIELGYKLTEIDMGADLSSVIQSINPDIVFNCLHGTYGEDGCVPALLNILRIPYTHSGVLASALAFDKIKSKDLMRAHNILVPKDLIVSESDNLTSDPLPRPYVIKPVAEGSSIGVDLIFEGDNFNFGDYIFQFGNRVIIEQYIKGRELQVAVLNGKAIDILEIELINKRFYDYEAKYTEGFTRHILPCNIPKNIYRRAIELSEQIYSIFGCRGMTRVELIYSEQDGEIYALEINTHPGMTPLSICPEIAAFCGISFNELVQMHIKEARYE